MIWAGSGIWDFEKGGILHSVAWFGLAWHGLACMGWRFCLDTHLLCIGVLRLKVLSLGI